MFKKRDLLVLLILIVGVFILGNFIYNLSAESNREVSNHAFGPQLNFANYSNVNLIIISIIGLIITMISAVLLERNISRVASKTGKGIGTALLGLASSIPLLIIVISLALENRGDLALVNIISANIANLTLVLGVLSFFKPLKRGKSFQKGFFALLILLISISTIFFSVSPNLDVANDTSKIITANEGYLLIALFFLFIAILSFFKTSEGKHLQSKNFSKEIFLSLFFGLIVAWCANTTVKAFIIVAENYSVPMIIIGSVIGVIGASLPELAIGLVCLIKKEHEAIFSNLITSSIVNFNLGLALTTLIAGSLVVDNISLYFKIPFMLFVMFVSLVFYLPRKSKMKFVGAQIKKVKNNIGLTRFEGLILLGLFSIWVIILIRLS